MNGLQNILNSNQKRTPPKRPFSLLLRDFTNVYNPILFLSLTTHKRIQQRCRLKPAEDFGWKPPGLPNISAAHAASAAIFTANDF